MGRRMCAHIRSVRHGIKAQTGSSEMKADAEVVFVLRNRWDHLKRTADISVDCPRQWRQEIMSERAYGVNDRMWINSRSKHVSADCSHPQGCFWRSWEMVQPVVPPYYLPFKTFFGRKAITCLAQNNLFSPCCQSRSGFKSDPTVSPITQVCRRRWPSPRTLRSGGNSPSYTAMMSASSHC